MRKITLLLWWGIMNYEPREGKVEIFDVYGRKQKSRMEKGKLLLIFQI